MLLRHCGMKPADRIRKDMVEALQAGLGRQGRIKPATRGTHTQPWDIITSGPGRVESDLFMENKIYFHFRVDAAEVERCSGAAGNPLFNTLCLENDAR